MMLDDTAVPICLPEADYDYTRLQVTVSGWGALASAPPGEITHTRTRVMSVIGIYTIILLTIPCGTT